MGAVEQERLLLPLHLQECLSVSLGGRVIRFAYRDWRFNIETIDSWRLEQDKLGG
jgi:hypothetical protein